MAVIEVDDLRFAYGEHAVLRGLSFAVEAGEVFALLGPNGAGKSTLLDCLLGLRRPSGGRIRVGGSPLGAHSRKELGRLVSLVPQVRVPAFEFTVEEIVLMGRNPYLPAFGSPGPADRRLVSEALAELGIGHLACARCTEISGGELQLVLVARALVQASAAILLDEPASHLDLHNQVVLLSLVRSLALRRRLAIVMVLHDPNHALLYADRAMLLKDGVAASIGTSAEVLVPERIREVYGVAVRLIGDRERPFIVPDVARPGCEAVA